MSAKTDEFTQLLGIEVPLICGAMYPCSNPELIAAVSEAGGIGIVQPISMTYVYGYDLADGIRKIRGMTDRPIGFNALVEQSSKIYLDRMYKWVDIAIAEGIRFFITALGDPGWVVERVHSVGGTVFHDVTEDKWARRGLDAGVDGLICVNSRAGGHLGDRSPQQLYDELAHHGVPLVCAGGIGDEQAFVEALEIGYSAVQMGTRFIATPECEAHDSYKQAIVSARASDIVSTDKISGVPVSVIETPHLRKVGAKAGPIMKRLLRHPKGKHYARMFYSLKSAWQLKRSARRGMTYRDLLQAGKSVDGIHSLEPAGDIVRRFDRARLEAQQRAS